ncbi:MAG: ABC transporter permease [Bacteroidales bacterium]|jgi:ABC-2 type transport system permease protein|nr:ABC transporter permease [Bacteroidales bacterium]MCR5555032.1 ABC transporter permease [Bacteroidales bacterium]
MSKILQIVRREYLQAVKKKSFIVMTILGPILLAALMIAPTLLMEYGNETVNIAVCDQSGIFRHLNADNDKDINFNYVEGNLEELKQGLSAQQYDALLYIPDDPISIGGMVYANSTLNTGVMSSILAAMKRDYTNAILLSEFNIAKDSLDTYVKRQTDNIALGYIHIDKNGVEETKASESREIQLVIGLLVGLVIYMFIFMYCTMVQRSVLEEKTNRIVEVIISSVKPVQLMIGKIVGVALIGLTQILIWIVFTGVIMGVVSLAVPDLFGTQQSTELMQQISAGEETVAVAMPTEGNHFLDAVREINFTQLILLFIFFFLAGYFLYASLFAAIGAAVDNDTDSQQFVLPLTVPLILAIVMSTYVADNPGGKVAFWMSMIPFTSPVTMMMRIPAGAEAVQGWEILLSCSILILTCAFAVWVAAKIYKTGILMYGKKTTYKELWRWIKYKN